MQRTIRRFLHRNRDLSRGGLPVAAMGQADHQQATATARVRVANQPI